MATELTELKNTFKADAEVSIPDYEKLSKTELANIYCDADATTPATFKSQRLMSSAFSALMLRYWSKVTKWIYDSASLKLEDIEFVSWLEHALYVAFYYREWRDEYKAKYKEGKFIEWKLDENGEKIPNPYYYKLDDTAVDKIINRCCFSIRGREYQFYNHDKRKTAVLSDSLDAMTEEVDDAALAFAGCVEDFNPFSGVQLLIEEFLKKNRKMDALILHEIAYDESATRRKVDGEKCDLFDKRKVIRNLAEADLSMILNFCEQYKVSEPEALFNELKGYTNPKLYKRLDKTLAEIRNNPKLLNCLLN